MTTTTIAALRDRLNPTRFSRRDWLRNIISLRVSESLFDDLSDDASAQSHLAQVELDQKPGEYAGQAIVERPFEESRYLKRLYEAVAFPFDNAAQSRFSDGRFGVWYGANTLLTGVHETVYHWHYHLIEGVRQKPAVVHYGERKVFKVRCRAALLDLRPQVNVYPKLLDKDDYRFCQRLGAALFKDGYPGLINRSARTPYPSGVIAAIFNPKVLENVRDLCYLSYVFHPGAHRVQVERKPGELWREITI